MKIAVLRANALGDLVVSLPALRSLRQRFPDAHITLAGRPLHQELASLIPVDEIVVTPLPLGVDAEEFQQRMREKEFDLAIQMHGGGAQSNPLIQQWHAKETIGFRAPGAPDLDRTLPYTIFQHEVLRFLELMTLVGCDATNTSVQICERGPATGPVVIHPGATDPRRRWDLKKFSQLITELNRECVLVGDASDVELCREIEVATGIKNLAGQLTLTALADLIYSAPLLIGNDSGPRHLAEALGTPTVGIFWIGNLINAGPLFRMRHRAHISWRLNCPACHTPAVLDDGTGMPRCAHDDSFVADVPVTGVLDDCVDLLTHLHGLDYQA